jgi:hypothetical protein
VVRRTTYKRMVGLQSLKRFFTERSVEPFDIVCDSIKMGDYPFFPPSRAARILASSSIKKKRSWLEKLLSDEGMDNSYDIIEKNGDLILVARGVYAIDMDIYREFPGCVWSLKYEVHFEGNIVSDSNLFRDGVIVVPTCIDDVYEQIDIPRGKFKKLTRKEILPLLSKKDRDKVYGCLRTKI